jgi:hypothetical protein
MERADDAAARTLLELVKHTRANPTLQNVEVVVALVEQLVRQLLSRGPTREASSVYDVCHCTVCDGAESTQNDPLSLSVLSTHGYKALHANLISLFLNL